MSFLCNEPLYIAIIGDIKSSKKISKREEVQEKLRLVLDRINNNYEDNIESKFIITLGDEFQGLLSNGKSVMAIISEIEKEMYPIKIRYGVGIGTVTTIINREMSIGADGPSYYWARDAIEYLKKNENKKQMVVADIRVEARGEIQQSDILLLNTVLSLMTVIKNSWSDRQRQIISEMLKSNETQSNIANRLNIKQPAVQKSLASGNYFAYKDAIHTIEKVMGEIGG